MSQRKCEACGYLFKGGDKVRAVILTEWVDLKSSVTYALAKPEDCINVVHRNCQDTKLENKEDYSNA